MTISTDHSHELCVEAHGAGGTGRWALPHCVECGEAMPAATTPVPAGISIWCRDCFKPATVVMARVPLCEEHREVEAERVGEVDPAHYDDEDEYRAAEIESRRRAYGPAVR